MNLLRLILYPISLLYGLITMIRNKFFDKNILKSNSFKVPVISVGNLTMGGTGKSPHVEYLIRLLGNDYNVTTLSRGYKRKTKGFILADENTSAGEIGDEPFQFKSKFENIQVAVDEKRVHGIEKILELKPDTDVVLLDDAFQHRYVKPGLSILLTDFHNLYNQDYIVPSGSLREFASGANRADIIVVTKCAKVLSPLTRTRINAELKPQPHQKLYFSYIEHGDFTAIPGLKFIPEIKKKYSTILLVAGIANSYPLEFYLKNRCIDLEILKFPDHHQYTKKDITRIVETYDSILSQKKVIVTTEKDAMRLMNPEFVKMLKHFPVCYVPIEMKFHKEDKIKFDNQIISYVKENSRDD